MGILVTCASESPTEPAPGGTEDEEDRDEIIFTRADNAYMTSPNDSTTNVYTLAWFGNPKQYAVDLPTYAIALYGSELQVLAIGLGGFYVSIKNDIGVEKRNSISGDDYLYAWATVRFDYIDERPIYYLNLYAWNVDSSAVEGLIQKHLERLKIGKLGKMTSGGCLLK